MPNWLNKLASIFTYKESVSDHEGFELLENHTEGRENSQPASDNTAKRYVEKKKSAGIKAPMKVKEWNEAKKEERAGTVEAQGKYINVSLQLNIERMRQEFNIPVNCDLIIREFILSNGIKACIAFIEGMTDKQVVNNFILRQLMWPESFNSYQGTDISGYIVDKVLSVNDIKKSKEFKKIISEVLNGRTALFVDGSEECILVETKGYEKRNVDKPVTESVVRGSQEGFTENLRTNITLIRKIIRNKNLMTEILPMGKTNHLNCAVLYMDGIADPVLIKEVKRRIKSIDADFIMGDGMLEQFIEDSPFRIFPQVINTERPDRAASFLMEGQVVIVTDGTPFALAMPVTFFRLFHTSEDSNVRWQFGTVIRFVRILGLLSATFLPGLYLALILYHQEMLPTDLLASIAIAKENVPFPTLVEVLLMELSFELIREAGIRVPGIIGTTLGIIGALILGQAAVAANIVSPILIIVVAITGLGNFAIPNYSLATGVRILRFFFILFGAMAGFYGMSAAIFIVGCIACSMKSFGVPFFSPIAPKLKTNPDVLIRQPIWKQKMRTDYLNTPNRKRQGDQPRGWVEKRGKERQ